MRPSASTLSGVTPFEMPASVVSTSRSPVTFPPAAGLPDSTAGSMSANAPDALTCRTSPPNVVSNVRCSMRPDQIEESTSVPLAAISVSAADVPLPFTTT